LDRQRSWKSGSSLNRDHPISRKNPPSPARCAVVWAVLLRRGTMPKHLLASLFVPLALASAAALAACGGGDDSGGDNGNPQSNNRGGDGGAGSDAMLFGNPQSIKSITVDPPSAAIEILNGSITNAKQPFKATAHFNDNTTQVLSNEVTWSVNNFQVGAI